MVKKINLGYGSVLDVIELYICRLLAELSLVLMIQWGFSIDVV